MQETSPATSTLATDDEISLLDLLLVVVENLKLLIAGPVLVGLVALGVAFALPRTYESTALLSAQMPGASFSSNTANQPDASFYPALIASLATSAAVLDAVAPAAGLAPGLSAEEMRKALAARLKSSVGRQDKLVTLTAQAPTAEGAQRLAQAVLEEVFVRSKPRSAERAQLERLLQSEEASLASSQQLEQTLAQQMATGAAPTGGAQIYTQLMAANSLKQQSILALRVKLNGLSDADLVQPPTLAETPIKPKKSLIAVLAALATGFVLLLFVFVRQAWRQAAASSESADKLQRIRRALCLKP